MFGHCPCISSLIDVMHNIIGQQAQESIHISLIEGAVVLEDQCFLYKIAVVSTLPLISGVQSRAAMVVVTFTNFFPHRAMTTSEAMRLRFWQGSASLVTALRVKVLKAKNQQVGNALNCVEYHEE